MKRPIATLTRTNEILTEYGLSAKKNFGQNFIIDPTVVEKIAKNALLDKETAVIEIGPGIGALSEQLAKYAKTVISYEIDTDLIEVLSQVLKEVENIEIIHQDFLTVDLNEIVKNLRKTHKKVVLCSNLPYYITTSILLKVFQCEEKIEAITVMMQKEVTDHFFLQPQSRDYGAINIIMESGFAVERVMKIPRTVFDPKPNVESAVLRFTAKENRAPSRNRERFFELVKACFKQRRKSLLNNYENYLHDREMAKKILVAANLDTSLRAEALSLEQFLNLFEAEMNERERYEK